MSPWPTTIYRLWQVLSSSDEDGDHDEDDSFNGDVDFSFTSSLARDHLYPFRRNHVIPLQVIQEEDDQYGGEGGAQEPPQEKRIR